MAIMDRQYRIVWIRDDKGTSGVLCPGPLTHDEACVALRKFTVHKCRRVLLEQIDAR